MDIENTTPFPTKVLRESVDDIYGLLIVTTKITYVCSGDGASLSRDSLPLHLEPDDEAPMGEINPMREPGIADLTVVGDVVTPNEKPLASLDVRLSWGDEVRTIRVFGDRVWLREGKTGFRASDPQPFVRKPMHWKFAFGGKHIIPAGFAPHSNLPMPSGEFSYSANPDGTGFYFEPEQVEGKPLPSLEDPAALVKDWKDNPRPACFAPMPMTTSLRGEHIAFDLETGDLSSKHGENEMTFARFRQNAPPWLQTHTLHPGTRIELSGMTKDKPFVFIIPPPPVHWLVTTGRRTRQQDVEILAVQLRPNDGLVTVLVGGKVFYPLVEGESRTASLVASKAAALQIGQE